MHNKEVDGSDEKPAATQSIIANSNGSVVNGGRQMLLSSGQKITIKFSAKPEPPGHHAAPSLSGSGQVNFRRKTEDTLE